MANQSDTYRETKPATNPISVLITGTSKNPYITLLCDHLNQDGVATILCAKMPSERWLWQKRHEIDVIHIQWIQPHYRTMILGRWGIENPFSFLRFIGKLLWAYLLGYKLVWTVHNLMPHQNYLPWLNYAGRLLVTRMAHAIIGHCCYSISAVKERFYRQHKSYLVPHGNYVGAYPNETDQKSARQRLGLADEDFVFLFLGHIKAYKGIDVLLESFRKLPQQNCTLLICGECRSALRRRTLLKLATQDPRIRFVFDYIPNEDLQYYFSASNVVVAPFQNILTSGSVILGLSLGRPVIAPSQGCLPELVTERVGILYDQEQPNGLYQALNAIQSAPVEQMGREALELITQDQYQWSSVAKSLHKIYKIVLKSGANRKDEVINELPHIVSQRSSH